MTPLERYNKMKAMRDAGASYTKIGQHFGISRQRAYQRLKMGPPGEIQRKKRFPDRFKIRVGDGVRILRGRY